MAAMAMLLPWCLCQSRCFMADGGIIDITAITDITRGCRQLLSLENTYENDVFRMDIPVYADSTSTPPLLQYFQNHMNAITPLSKQKPGLDGLLPIESDRFNRHYRFQKTPISHADDGF